MTTPVTRRPSPAYYYTSAAAAIGLVCIAIAIDGTRRASTGGHDMGAINTAGVGALIFAWALAYYMRFAFAPTVSAKTKSLVVRTTRIVFAAEAVAALLGSIYVFASPAATSAVEVFIIIGDLLQVGSLLWIFRYSRQGLNGAADR